MAKNRNLSGQWETWFTRSPGGEPRARIRDLTENATLVLNHAIIAGQSEWTATVRLALKSHDITRDFELEPVPESGASPWPAMQAAAESEAIGWLRELASETASAIEALDGGAS